MACLRASSCEVCSSAAGFRQQGDGMPVPCGGNRHPPEVFDLRTDESSQESLSSTAATPEIYELEWHHRDSGNGVVSAAAEQKGVSVVVKLPVVSQNAEIEENLLQSQVTSSLLRSINMLTTDTVSLDAFLEFPQAFRNMVNLTIIQYEGLQLEAHRLDSLGYLPSLKQLHLKNCGLQNLDFLIAFVGGAPLEDIDVACNAISALPPRTAFTQVNHPHRIKQSQSQVTATKCPQKQSGAFPLSLRTLDLSGNAIEDVSSLEALAAFPSLEVLRLFGNKLNKDLAFNTSFVSLLMSCPLLQHSVCDGLTYVSCPDTNQPFLTRNNAHFCKDSKSPRYKAGVGLPNEHSATLENAACDKERKDEQEPAADIPCDAITASGAQKISTGTDAQGNSKSHLVKNEHPECDAHAVAQRRIVTHQPEQRDTRTCFGLGLDSRLDTRELDSSAQHEQLLRRSSTAGQLSVAITSEMCDCPQADLEIIKKSKFDRGQHFRNSIGESGSSEAKRRSVSEGSRNLPPSQDVDQHRTRMSTRSAVERRPCRWPPPVSTSSFLRFFEEKERMAYVLRSDIPALLGMYHNSKVTEATLRSQQRQCYLATQQKDIQANAHFNRCKEHLARLQRARRAFISGLYRLSQTPGAANLYERTATAIAQLESLRQSLPAVSIPGATEHTILILQALLRLWQLEQLLISRFLTEAQQYLRCLAHLTKGHRELRSFDAACSATVAVQEYIQALLPRQGGSTSSWTAGSSRNHQTEDAQPCKTTCVGRVETESEGVAPVDYTFQPGPSWPENETKHGSPCSSSVSARDATEAVRQTSFRRSGSAVAYGGSRVPCSWTSQQRGSSYSGRTSFRLHVDSGGEHCFKDSHPQTETIKCLHFQGNMEMGASEARPQPASSPDTQHPTPTSPMRCVGETEQPFLRGGAHRRTNMMMSTRSSSGIIDNGVPICAENLTEENVTTDPPLAVFAAITGSRSISLPVAVTLSSEDEGVTLAHDTDTGGSCRDNSRRHTSQSRSTQRKMHFKLPGPSC
ncbi:leucine rich repeat-containing protein [Toxoplasma gondii GAB2-2007-GAL-DOM2]|uniref:Leucine rich repeat-containing protein n=2 Tax=Toxoplasma gondii TaxID=5811 RepID=A0A086LCZ4_TOXGO|nr:leucine rich repeat-containing protein [Toxoplasma gondii GAB2-2007-GAL-DOM2]KFG54512.1 leucine rich repeat-containing protein [Toxoplasma gondii FOU]